MKIGVGRLEARHTKWGEGLEGSASVCKMPTSLFSYPHFFSTPLFLNPLYQQVTTIANAINKGSQAANDRYRRRRNSGGERENSVPTNLGGTAGRGSFSIMSMGASTDSLLVHGNPTPFSHSAPKKPVFCNPQGYRQPAAFFAPGTKITNN